VPEDDRQYLVDLGLLRRAEGGRLVVASPIYREVLPRALASGPQDSLPQIAPTWLIGISEQDAVTKEPHPSRPMRFASSPHPTTTTSSKRTC